MTDYSDLLSQALRAPSDPPLRPLPSPVVELLRSLDAPPRLAAHLRAVHDVAVQLVDWLERRHPRIIVDRAAVAFGAATHDIGKTVHPAELSAPGSSHEEAGRKLLLARGFGPDLARFAGTHASWAAPGTTLEDLLVSTADKVWKNKRLQELEDLLIARLVHETGGEHWEEYLALDDLLTRIGDAADGRLAFQASYPVHG
ncbi:HD domain-containing protein [Streptomyces sp. CG 926]|uniref:HD domain-containing protein n=1 Tax=Streptomyces sp. CG 926 TaxID=1882405 RepID=UPI00215B2AB8|nr:HD domain-containing protein [Streptomyces sp. CG 926]